MNEKNGNPSSAEGQENPSVPSCFSGGPETRGQREEARNEEPDPAFNHETSSAIARGSTGPRTTAGKTVSKNNATTHGIFAEAILKSESRTKYDELLKGFVEDFKPEGALENYLTQKLAILPWRYRRLVCAERDEIEQGPNVIEFGAAKNSAVLDRLPRYEACIERSFDRTLVQLERNQRMRLGLPVLPPVKIDITS